MDLTSTAGNVHLKLRKRASLENGVSPGMKPPKQLSQDAVKSVRRKRLTRRMEKKYPLFADQMIDEELQSNPDYYEGITDPEIQAAKDRVIQGERDRYERYMEMLKNE